MNQPQHMAMAGMGGPVGGGGGGGGNGGPIGQPVNAGTPTIQGIQGIIPDTQELIRKLNTAIYDYLLCNEKYEAARAVLKQLPIETADTIKQSPNQRSHQTNGVDDSMELDSKDHNMGIQKRPDDLPAPKNPSEISPFLQDWWCQFWEIYHGNRQKGKPITLSYIYTQRQSQKARQGMMAGNADPNAMRNMPSYNGLMNSQMELKKRATMQNLSPAQMAQMRSMNGQNPANQGNQMERQGSQMDANGPRSGSPNTGDAPSPKRPRIDGNMQQLTQGRPGQPGQMQGNQVGPPSNIPPTPYLPLDALLESTRRLLQAKGFSPEAIAAMNPEQLQRMQEQPTNMQAKSIEMYSAGLQAHMQTAMQRNNSNTNKGPMPQTPNMPGPGGAPGAQSSPMSQAAVDGAEFYNASRMPGMPQNGNAMTSGQAGGAAAAVAAAAQTNGNHALQDYQMQLMLLEQQNKKRLLMARQEQDSMSHPPGVPAPNGGVMDPSLPPGMRTPMMMTGHNGQMMRPPSSHPMQGQMTPQQLDMMSRQGQMMPNGGNWQAGGPQPPPGQMMPGQQPSQGGPQGQPPNMTPRPNNMPPPPAPQATNAGNTQPSSPAQPPAPPTPSQNKPKAGGNKKNDNKSSKVSTPDRVSIATGYFNKTQAAANKKGGAGATEVADAPTPTPPPPVTPNSAANFQPNKNSNMANGQPNQAQQQNNNVPNGQPPANAVPPSQPDIGVGPPFGALDGAPDQFDLGFTQGDSGDLLDNFDFDIFLNNTGEDAGYSLDPNFSFGDSSLEAGGDAGGL